MFALGDRIIYGNSGVCCVEAIGRPQSAAADSTKLYYTLRPVYGSETIYTPVDTPVFMRPVISRGEAQRLIRKIPSLQAEVCDSPNLAKLTAHYQDVLHTNDCQNLLQMVKGVYAKNEDAGQNGKKLGQTDQRYWRRAEELLHGELAVALDISRDEVADYITIALSQNGGEMEREECSSASTR